MSGVAYLYNEDITKYEFSKEHPMKTRRMKMVHSLINNYELDSKLLQYHSKEATSQEMMAFHHPQYIKYLETWVSPQSSHIVQQYSDQNERATIRDDTKLTSIFKVNQSPDCPGFEGLYNFCRLAAGSSIDAADLIITGEADVVLNWAGGYHHAKKIEASGFCYINDIVLCILELLKVYPRVLYLDIDVHHGDGVQEAFYRTNRVMTVSFHEFEEDFFPGTGALSSIGEGIGKYFTINVPLKRGIDDDSYCELFKRIMKAVMASFVPEVVVIQCGADSLSKDRLGHLNLSILGHADCINHMRSYNVPLILLGGGGYTVENVARCWTFETAMMLNTPIDNMIPKGDLFYSFYEKENHKLLFQVDKTNNNNSKDYLNGLIQTITQNLKESEIRPSIAFHNAPKHFAPSQQTNYEVMREESESSDQHMDEQIYQKI